METTSQNINSVSGQYLVKSLDSFTKVEIDPGFLLVRKIEKQKGMVSKGVIVPDITVEDAVLSLENDAILQGFVEWYRGRMVECVKNGIALGKDHISAAQFGMAAINDLCESEMFERSDISSDQLGKWFDGNLATELGNAFRLKVGADKEEKIASIVAGYRKVICSLSSAKTTLDDATTASIKKAVGLIPYSAWTNWIEKRLVKREEKVDLESL
jgi:hypothetical protein